MMLQKNINLIALVFNKTKMYRFMGKLFLSFIVLVSFCGLLQAQNPVGSTGVELEQQVFEIARQVRCPVCRAESAADSNATTSIEFRNIIQEKLEEGQSEAEIIAYFQSIYGDWILLDPPKRGLHLIVWIAPLVAAFIAVIAFVILLRRWTQKANRVPDELSTEELAQVKAALNKVDYKNVDHKNVDYKNDDSGATL